MKTLVAMPRAGLTAVLAVMLVCVAGCGDGAKKGPASGPVDSGAANRSATAESARKKLEAATTAGVRADQGQAQIEMRFSVDGNPLPGEPFKVTVTVMPGISAPTLKVEVPTVEGMELAPISVPTVYDKVEPGALYSIPLEFRAASPGVKIVTVVATEQSPTGSDSATYSFPVIVGAAALLQTAAPAPASPAAPAATPAAKVAPAAVPKSS